MASSTLTVIIAPDPPARLDKALSRDVPEAASLSRTRLARMIAAGQVRVNGAVLRDAKARVAAGDQVELTIEEAGESHIAPEAIALDILYEDDALVVVNKPAGMVVHPAPGSSSGTLVNALLHHCGNSLSGVGGMRRPGIVHRIDKDTSGVLVVAKSDSAHHGLARQFEAHRAERYYRAVVYGEPEANDPRLRGIKGVSFEPGNVMKITTRLDRHRHDRQRQAVTFSGGRHAVTRARILEKFGTPVAASLMECWLETGRTHQIRVHMAHAGHALVGDATYGGRRKLSPRSLPPSALEAVRGFHRQALHAAVLGFVHPVTGEEMRFEAPMPPDMEQLIEALRG